MAKIEQKGLDKIVWHGWIGIFMAAAVTLISICTVAVSEMTKEENSVVMLETWTIISAVILLAVIVCINLMELKYKRNVQRFWMASERDKSENLEIM